MTLIDEAVDVHRIASSEVPWLDYPLIPGSLWRVLHVDEDTNTVILNFRFGPWSKSPVHGHYCTATAYTLEGEWFYDDLSFAVGDVAFETTVGVHQPVAGENGATLLTTLIGGRGNDRLLEDHNEDGSKTLLRTRLFKACERISAEDYAKLDFARLLN